MSYIQTRARSAANASTQDENTVKPGIKALSQTNGKPTLRRPALADLSNKTVALQVKKNAKPVKPGSAKKRTVPQPATERVKPLKTRQPLAPKRMNEATVEVQVPSKAVKLEKKPTLEISEPGEETEAEEAQEPIKETEQYWEDLDAEDADDPNMASEYVLEIFEYLRELEQDTLPDPNYMDGQTEITWKMRTILVDWLVDVHSKFRLLPETLFLAINIMDRFLSRRTVSLTKLQLVGITSLFIASKYEEVVHPSVKNFIYMADNGYPEEEVLKSERYILQVLDFGLHYPNPMNFLRRISKAENYNLHSRTIAKYLLELTLLDQHFLEYPVSLVTAAAAYLSRQMVKTTVWSQTLRFYSGGYSEKQVSDVANEIKELVSKPNKYEAIYKKYAAKKFMKVSIFVADYIRLQSMLNNDE